MAAKCCSSPAISAGSALAARRSGRSNALVASGFTASSPLHRRLSRLTASSSSFAATVAPSVRIVPATAVARARVSGARAVLSAADRDSKVGVGPSCAAPMPSSATRPAQYGWSAIWGTTT